MKKNLPYVAGFLMLLCASFTFESGSKGSRVEWFWTDHIQVPIVLVVTSCILFAVYLMSPNESQR